MSSLWVFIPPAQSVLLIDGHESVMELIIHSLHNGIEEERGRNGGERKIEREGRERGRMRDQAMTDMISER
jgi:hypothetical protein